MSQTITLYVDGACRGNPGLGGWVHMSLPNRVNINYLAVNPTQQITVWNLLRLLKEFLALLMLN